MSWSVVGAPSFVTGTNVADSPIYIREYDGDLYVIYFIQGTSIKMYCSKWNGSVWAEIGCDSSTETPIIDNNGEMDIGFTIDQSTGDVFVFTNTVSDGRTVIKYNGSTWDKITSATGGYHATFPRITAYNLFGNSFLMIACKNPSGNITVETYSFGSWGTPAEIVPTSAILSLDIYAISGFFLGSAIISQDDSWRFDNDYNTWVHFSTIFDYGASETIGGEGASPAFVYDGGDNIIAVRDLNTGVFPSAEILSFDGATWAVDNDLTEFAGITWTKVTCGIVDGNIIVSGINSVDGSAQILKYNTTSWSLVESPVSSSCFFGNVCGDQAGNFIYYAYNDTTSGSLTVLQISSLADFSGDVLSGEAPLVVAFTNLSEVSITKFLWEFGDNTISYDEAPVHTYREAGTYTVILTITYNGSEITETKENYILVYPGGLKMGITNKCYGFSALEENGVGVNELAGDDFPMPETRTGVVEIIDESDQPHLLVLDGADGGLYSLSTFNGYGNNTKRWKDKVLADGTGGTDFDRELTFPEDTGTHEKYFLEHNETHVYLRPEDESNRDQSGYDSNGYPTGMEVSVEIHEDGDPTPLTTTSDIPKDGDIVFDKKSRANRLNTKLIVNRGDHVVSGVQQEYIRQDDAASPSNKTMTEMGLMEELASPTFWVGVYNNSVVNRITGAPITGFATIEGVTGDETAIVLTHDGLTFQTLGTVSLTNGSILLWAYSTFEMKIDGTLISFDLKTTNGSWKLYYAEGITQTGDIEVKGLSTVFFGRLDTVRFFASALSADAITYFSDDIVNNNGKIVRPL